MYVRQMQYQCYYNGRTILYLFPGLLMVLVLMIAQALLVGAQLAADEAKHVAVGKMARVHMLHHVGLVLGGVAALDTLPPIHPLQVYPLHSAQHLA